jgi:hypothetical protein
MPAARHSRKKSLIRAKFYARWIRRHRESDVACNGHSSRIGFRRVRVARRGNLHRRGRWHVNGSGVHAIWRDRSYCRASTCRAVHAPDNNGVCRVRDFGGKRRRIPEQHRSAFRRDRHNNGRRRRRRRKHSRACASCAAALCPRYCSEQRDKNRCRDPKFSCVELRERSHTLRKAGEGPAKNGMHGVRECGVRFGAKPS